MNQSNVRIDPKTNYYYSNGTGRDTYILNCNAGFSRCEFKNDVPNKHNRNFSMNFSTNSRYTNKQIEPRTNHYHSDGSGRDNYIVSTEGGNITGAVTTYGDIKKALQLRNYQKSMLINKDDFYQISQKQYKTNLVAQSILRQRQFDASSSLSIPKYSQLMETCSRSPLKNSTLPLKNQTSPSKKNK